MEVKMNKTLKELRKLKKLSQFEVAKILGVSPMSYQQWERGVTTPNKENDKKLKDFFGEYKRGE